MKTHHHSWQSVSKQLITAHHQAQQSRLKGETSSGGDEQWGRQLKLQAAQLSTASGSWLQQAKSRLEICLFSCPLAVSLFTVRSQYLSQVHTCSSAVSSRLCTQIQELSFSTFLSSSGFITSCGSSDPCFLIPWLKVWCFHLPVQSHISSKWVCFGGQAEREREHKLQIIGTFNSLFLQPNGRIFSHNLRYFLTSANLRAKPHYCNLLRTGR